MVGVEPHRLCDSEEVPELPQIGKTSAPDRVHQHPLAEGFLYGVLCGAALIVGLINQGLNLAIRHLITSTSMALRA